MKTNRTLRTLALSALLLSILNAQRSTAFAQGTAFTYQGSLTDNGSPTSGIYDLRFAIYEFDTGGSPVAGPLTNNAVAVSNGLFTVILDFGGGVFNGSNLWLELGVVTNGGGAFTTLVPRQHITATPYAIKAANAMTVDMGTISDPSFVGTTTTAPLDLFVNNQRGLRLEYAMEGLNESVNVIGGYSGNFVSNGVIGATIAGGGTLVQPFNFTNKVEADFGVVSGGVGNTAAGQRSTVSGGSFNTAGGFASVVGGGYANTADGSTSTIRVAPTTRQAATKAPYLVDSAARYLRAQIIAPSVAGRTTI